MLHILLQILLELTNFHLDEGGLLWQRPWQHPGVAEARPQQHGHDEEEEEGSEDRNGRGQMDGQVGTSETQGEKKGLNDLMICCFFCGNCRRRVCVFSRFRNNKEKSKVKILLRV